MSAPASTRGQRFALLCLLLTGCGIAFGPEAMAQAPESPPVVTPAPGEASYRTVRIDVAVPHGSAAEAWQIWFSGEDFESLEGARLHSVIRRGAVAGLDAPPPGAALDDCWNDGVPVHRDAEGVAVIDPGARRWSCALTGLQPGRDQWVAVIPVDAEGRSLLGGATLAPLRVRTDAPDERTPPPDSRPVTYALGMIVIAVVALLSFLRWMDARRGRTRSRLAHLYVAPAVLGLAALTFYPILYGIWLAFTNADQSHLGETEWVGLGNFVTVFQTPGFWRVTGFTLVWSVSNVVFHVSLGLLLAVLLNRRGLRGKTVYRTILLLPWAIPAYISILAWNGMLQPDGLVNNVLGTQIDFLANPNSARVMVILVNIWLGVPFMMASFSGALQALSRDMYEAAELDGVSRRDQFLHLTLPNLKSTMVPVSLLGFIWSFNAFTTIYLLSRGGPYVGFGEPGATDILVTYVFDVAFTFGHYGLAAAWSVVIFLMLVGFSAVYVSRTRATEAAA